MVTASGMRASHNSQAHQKEMNDEKAAAEKRLGEEKENLDAEKLKEREKEQMKERRKKGGTAETATVAAAVNTEKEKVDGKGVSRPDVVVVDNATPAGEPGTEKDAPNVGINDPIQQLNSGQGVDVDEEGKEEELWGIR